METQISTTQVDQAVLDKIIMTGDISGLSDAQKKQYYIALCNKYGLDPLTQPFNILKVQGGKEQLYANRSTTDQIREQKGLTSRIVETKEVRDIFLAVAEVSDGKRAETSTGAVNIKGLSGDALANAMMKAETKAKRRATLSYLGLAMMDETEAETVEGERRQVELQSPINHASDRDQRLLKALEDIESMVSTGDLLILWKRQSEFHGDVQYEAALKSKRDELVAKEQAEKEAAQAKALGVEDDVIAAFEASEAGEESKPKTVVNKFDGLAKSKAKKEDETK